MTTRPETVIDRVTLIVSDLDRAEDDYVRTFGCSVEQRGDIGALPYILRDLNVLVGISKAVNSVRGLEALEKQELSEILRSAIASLPGVARRTTSATVQPSGDSTTTPLAGLQ